MTQEVFFSLNRFLFSQRSAISKDEERPSNVFINKHDRYEPSQIYWDQDGNLRYGKVLQVYAFDKRSNFSSVLSLQDKVIVTENKKLLTSYRKILEMMTTP